VHNLAKRQRNAKVLYLSGFGPKMGRIKPGLYQPYKPGLRGGCSTLLVARAASAVQRVSLTLIGAWRNEISTYQPGAGKPTQIKLQRIP
jgi:hypothetical protein